MSEMHKPRSILDLYRGGDGFLMRFRTARAALVNIAEILDVPPEAGLDELVARVDELENGKQLRLPMGDE